ncbi:hypothetical protein QIS74_07232 [Colletotrichum tabaci]|uniref:Uncharacterized protein n=1 Tax=Colletotrichum tabaci TaxID=1209068 RepID=A0AAV9TAS6_9PEZI
MTDRRAGRRNRLGAPTPHYAKSGTLQGLCRDPCGQSATFPGPVLPHDAEDAALERRDGDPKLLTRIHFSGVVDSETGRKHEIIANHFEGNNTVLHLPALDQAAMASRDLSKRVGAAGFKISYTTRAQSLLTRSHQQEMSGCIASAWSIAAENYRLEDYIGLAKTDHNANFYWRIIPELYGFGLNYESVDVCGGMAGYL